jgi:hypothetical protein
MSGLTMSAGDRLAVILDYDPERRIAVPLVGCSEDACVRVDGRWLFEHRIIRGDLGRRPV